MRTRVRRGRLSIPFAAAWLATLILTSGLVWAITWFRPPQGTSVLLVGAGYETNLSIPHNVYGWNSLQQIWQYLQPGSVGGNSLFVGTLPPQQLTPEFRWKTLLEQAEQDTILLFVSAHGDSDLHGPYLMVDDSSTAGAAWLEQRAALAGRLHVEKLLDALASLPAEREKVICLDATQLNGAPRLGVLYNEFSRGMLRLNERIAEIPNLVVICSSGPDQISWYNAAWRSSVFGHYLLAEMSGAVVDTDNNGRISVEEFHQQLARRVGDWSRKHRGVQQTPLLLPTGEEGLTRAKSIELDVAGKGTGTLPRLEINRHFAQLGELWQRFQKLQQRQPAVYSYAPALWREYVDTLIRYDELIRAGDQESAETLFQRLGTIEYRALRERIQSYGSIENSLSVHTLARESQLPIEQGQRLLDRLWTLKQNEAAKLLEEEFQKLDDAPVKRDLLRLAIYQTLIQRVIDDPQNHLDRGARLAKAMQSPLHPLPAEIHFMAMLAQHLPEGALQQSSPLIAEALKVRCLAERAAVAHVDQSTSSAERVIPWIEGRLGNADAARRLGEDLLFADVEDRRKATGHFAQARRGYEQVLDDAEQVQAAFEVRNRVFALLPYYSEWLADAALDPYVADARHEDMVALVETLWHRAHELSDMLHNPDPRWITKAPPPAADGDGEFPQSLAELRKTVRVGWDTVTGRYAELAKKMATGQAPPQPLSLQRALTVPHADWALRSQLLTRLQEAMTVEAVDSTPPGQEPGATQSNNDGLQKTWRKLALKSSNWQGRLSLAMLGRWAFAGYRGPDDETYDQVAHRLELLEVEQDWWKSCTVAGEQIGRHYAGLPEMIRRAVRKPEGQSGSQTRVALRTADMLARQVDGAQAAKLPAKPAALYRRYMIHQVALLLAQRTLDDHWFALEPEDEPYFLRAATAYVNDAQRIFPKSSLSKAMSQKLRDAVPFEISQVQPIELTTQHRLQLRYQILSAKRKATINGLPVSWLQCGPGLHLIEPPAGQRLVRQVSASEQGQYIPFDVQSPLLDRAEKEGYPRADNADSQLTLNVFYRGRRIQQKVPVRIHLQPELLIRRHPLPEQAALAVTTSAEIQQSYGPGSGAVAFVLDCSGSMGPADGNGSGRSKYAEAVAALKQMLQGVPQGTQVSLWTFGEAMGPDRTAVSAEATIRQVLAPVAWDPSDKNQLIDLMQRIDPNQLIPWNQSPIVRTVLTAKNDVAGASGFRSIVVITDGMDNRFADDQTANPTGGSIPEAITSAFDGSGISLNVIGFKVADAEQAEVQRQFSVVERLTTPGRFDLVSHIDALSSALDASLRNSLQFRLQAYAGPSSPEPLDLGRQHGGQVWPMKPFEPGSYRLQIKADQLIAADVTLRSGDALSLSLEKGDSGLALHRPLAAKTVYAHRPSASTQRWHATLLQNQIDADRGYRATVGLEPSTSASSGEAFAQTTPKTIWFSLQAAETARKTSPLSWSRVVGFPLATWSLESGPWPVAAEGHGPKKRTIEMWWNTGQRNALLASVRRDKSRPHVADLVGTVLRGAEKKLTIESVGIESHFVEIAAGKRAERSCLVVRLQHEPEAYYWCEPIGLETAGSEQRFYPSAGAYTGLFWPVTEEVAQRALQGIGVVSLQSFQREAEIRGEYLKMTDVPRPDANDVLPTPAYSFP